VAATPSIAPRRFGFSGNANSGRQAAGFFRVENCVPIRFVTATMAVTRTTLVRQATTMIGSLAPYDRMDKIGVEARMAPITADHRQDVRAAQEAVPYTIAYFQSQVGLMEHHISRNHPDITDFFFPGHGLASTACPTQHCRKRYCALFHTVRAKASPAINRKTSQRRANRQMRTTTRATRSESPLNKVGIIGHHNYLRQLFAFPRARWKDFFRRAQNCRNRSQSIATRIDLAA